MTDLANDIASEAPTSSMISVPVKGMAGTFVEVDTAKIPDEFYREALLLGMKELVSRRMSKLTKSNITNEDERKAEIVRVAHENVELIYANDSAKIKLSTGSKKSATKASGAVMTEARRLAKNLVKDAMKANGIKISHVAASEITKAANALLDADPSIIATAEANLKAREATPVAIDITKLIHTDPALVAKAEAKKAADKANRPLSAKQAGKVAPRKKGQQPQAQA